MKINMLLEEMAINDIQEKIAVFESDRHDETSLLGVVIEAISFDGELYGDDDNGTYEQFAVKVYAREAKSPKELKEYYKAYLWDTTAKMIAMGNTITKEAFLDESWKED